MRMETEYELTRDDSDWSQQSAVQLPYRAEAVSRMLQLLKGDRVKALKLLNQCAAVGGDALGNVFYLLGTTFFKASKSAEAVGGKLAVVAK